MTKIPLGTVSINDRQIELVAETLRNNRLSYGPMTRAFEAKLAEIHEVQHAIFMASGTCALQVVLEALKQDYRWPEGSEVLIPATTFVATAAAVRHARLKPIMVDVEMQNYNIDPTQLTKWITPRTKAVLLVHLLGRMANMNAIVSHVGAYRYFIVEDACEAFGMGDASSLFWKARVISTYVCHHMTTGVGGAVLMNDDRIAEMCRSLMQHGRNPKYLCMEDDDNLTPEEMQEMMKARYRFERWGHSYRSTEMEAALGLGFLEMNDVDAMAQVRRNVAVAINTTTSPFREHIAEQLWPADSSPLFYPFVMNTPQNCKGLSEAFEAAGIETRPMMPLLTQPVVMQDMARKGGSCWIDYPNATKLCHHAFLIGCHRGIGGSELELIYETMRSYFGDLK